MLFNVGIDRIVVSYCVARVQVAAIIIDLFDYSLVVAVYVYFPLCLYCKWIKAGVLMKESNSGGDSICFSHARVCIIVMSRYVTLATP